MERHRSSLLIRLLESLQDPKLNNKTSSTPSWQKSSRRILEPDSSRRQISYDSESCKNLKFPKLKTLVGRDTQFKLLSECFERMTVKKSVEVVVIHGTAGSGKSSLVQAFTKNYLPPEVLHVYGKFDQLHSHAPYSALVTASDQLCRQILRTPNCATIRDRIRAVLGPDVNLLGNLIPTLVEMTTAPKVEDKDAMNTSSTANSMEQTNVQRSFTRFKLLFRAFLRSVASVENPLVFFLDDLQWADSASLEVLKSIITDKQAHNILILCAFREGEISNEILKQYHLVDGCHKDDGSHSSSSSTQFFSAHVTDIVVDCLDSAQLNELICFRLGMDPSTTETLSQLVWNKTNGNPFYTLSFIDMLYRNCLLTKESSGTWTWNEAQILRNTDVSDNLASILESRLQSLSDQVLSILQMASFIGYEFPTSVLVTIVYEEQDTIATEYSFQRQSKQVIRERITAALKAAVTEGLLEETHKDDEYKFAHDKIQEVLYETLMPDMTERQLLHQRIGTLIWDSVKFKEKSQVDDWFIFLATDNLNQAVDLVDYSGDRFYLVELNLTAAKRTIHKSAFLMASEYLRLAVDLMKNKTCWEERYDLCLDLFNTAAETEKNIGNYSRSATLIAIIHHNAKYIHHRSAAFSIEMDSLSAQGNVKGSAILGLKVLRQLGIRFPRKINMFVVLKELLTTNVSLGKRRLQDLLSLKEIKDENVLLSLSIMNTIAVNAFILGDSFKATYAVICLRMFRITLKHGISKMHSPMAIVAWGSLNAVMGRFDVALESEKLAFNVIDKYNVDSIRGTTIISSYSVNHFWRENLDSDSRHEFFHAYQIAMSFGHVNIAQYGFVGWVVAAMYLNDRLSDVHLKTRSVVGEMREFDSKSGLMFLLPTWQAVSCVLPM
jgi:predicted ATPase